MTDAETPIAWPALERGTPVYTSDGEELGKVADVIADEAKDIFSGITVNPGWFKDERFVPADLVDALTSQSVRLTVSAAEADATILPSGEERA